MKKFLCVLLAVTCISLVACGGNTSLPKEVQPVADNVEEQVASKEVQLTVENISKYLAFDYQLGYSDITMKYYAVSAGSFNNVNLDVEVSLTFNENREDIISYSFRVPVSGEYTHTQKLSAPISTNGTRKIKYTVKSVSGTFIPYN